MKKSITALILALSLLPMLFACTPAASSESQSERESESQSEGKTEELTMDDVTMTLKAAEEHIRILGRSYFDGDSLVCDNVADGIEFRLRFNGELSLTVTSDRNSYYTVYMDGERIDTRFCFETGESTAVIAENDDDEIHEIRILSQNEAQMSLSTLDAIEFHGRFEKAPAERKYYIEYVGDSLTTGYGNLVPGGTPDAGQSPCQDGTQTYTFMTAETFDADCMITGCSGIGVTRGWMDFTMDAFFPAASYYRDTEAEYAYTRTPDLIVISLGTNDVYAPSNPINTDNPDDYDCLMQGFIDLVSQIEEYYDASIPMIFLHGMATSRLDGFIPKLVEQLGGEAAGMYALHMTPAGSGGGGHPSVEEHENATETLVDFIREKNILE